jgi:bacteriorhodopsin
LLEEYKHLLDFILAANDTLHRFAGFYFTCISIFFGGVFWVIRDRISQYDGFILSCLSIIPVFAGYCWCANASRTKVKLESRVQRAKEIERRFKRQFGDCLQMLRLAGRHLDENEDCSGNSLHFFSRRTNMIVKFSKFLFWFWVVILVFGALVALDILHLPQFFEEPKSQQVLIK